MKKLFYSFIFFMIFQSSYAQPGSIDLSFGNNGSIVYNDNFIITSTLIQPDGKIVVAGYEAGVANAVIKRYHLDGSLDTSFQFQSGITHLFSAALDAKLLSDGSYVAMTVFTNDLDVGPFFINLVKINADGSKNTAFNSPVILADMSNEYLFFMGSDGKPGYYSSPNQSTTGMVNVTKFLPNGALDFTFGNNGVKEVTIFNNPPDLISFEDMDNSLIADDAGNFYFTFKMGNDYYISKTDLNFNTFQQLIHNNIGRKYTFYHNNALYNGYSHGQGNSLQKFSSAGFIPDMTYGTNSVAHANFPINNFQNLTTSGFIQPDGKGVVISAYSTEMKISRFMDNGTVDPAFGNNGTLAFASSFPAGYNMSALYAAPTKKLYIINVDEDNARFMMTRIDLGETALSVNDIKSEKPFSIFPNPVSDYVYFPENIVEVSIIDLSGRKLFKTKVSDRKIDLSHLTSGTYFIQTKNSKNEMNQQKLIKK